MSAWLLAAALAAGAGIVPAAPAAAGDGSSGDIPVDHLPGWNRDVPRWIRFGYMSASVGWRQSITLGAAGLDARVGIGGFFGPIGVELESGWTADHTLQVLTAREAARHTTWLNVQVKLHPIERLAVLFGVGPGLGWIKVPADEPMVRHPSQGLREWAQLSVFLGEPVGRYAIAVRAGPEQLWQSGVIDGVEHAFTLRVMMTVGALWEPE